MSTKSWFQTYVAHPFVAAFEDLTKAPAIAQNPAAAQAVADAKAQASAVASAGSTAAAAIISDAQAAEDPALAALGDGLTVAFDAFLVKSIGPLGEQMIAPAGNTLIALGLARGHQLLDALAAHAQAQLAAAKPS